MFRVSLLAALVSFSLAFLSYISHLPREFKGTTGWVPVSPHSAIPKLRAKLLPLVTPAVLALSCACTSASQSCSCPLARQKWFLSLQQGSRNLH